MNLIDDASLLKCVPKLAEAELLGEAKRARVRHSIAGPSGWKPVPKTNKTFFVNTLLQTLSSNKILARKQGGIKDKSKYKKKERKFLQGCKNGANNNFLYKKPSKTDSPKQSTKVHSSQKCDNKRQKKPVKKKK